MARPRGPNSWEGVIFVAGKRVRRSFPTEAKAATWEQESKAKVQLGMPIDAPKAQAAASLTLRELFDKVYEREWKGTKGEATALINSAAVCKILGEGLPITSITVGHIDVLIEKLRQLNNSDATINRKLAALSKAMRHAEERGWIDRAPKFSRLAETKGRIRFASDQEEKAALAHFEWAGDKSMADLWTLLIDTGMRLGEALRLLPKDCELKPKPVIRIWENKADHPRSVPMTSRVVEVVKRRMGLKLDTPIFDDLDKRVVRYRWDKMKQRLGLAGDDQFIPHMLRHTTASRLVQRGVPLMVVKDWLGHKTISTTMRYAHLAPDNLFAAASVLEAPAPTKEVKSA